MILFLLDLEQVSMFHGEIDSTNTFFLANYRFTSNVKKKICIHDIEFKV